MKIEIDISEFYLDEDRELEPALRQFIIREVTNSINSNIKKQVEGLTNDLLVNVIQSELQTRVKVLIDEFVKTGTVKDRSGYGSDSGKSKPISEWIGDQVRASNSDIVESIKKLAATQVNQLKAQYDLLFATQIVNKIKEAGYLKEDAAKLLLTDQK